MDRFTNSFNEHSESLRLKREVEDRDDLNFAQGDVEVGRMRKHLPSEAIDPITRKSKKQMAIEAAIQRTLEWLLLNDANYRLAHENLIGAVRSAQDTTQTTLERIMDALMHERSVMQDLLNRAAQLPDGTKVFKDKNGNVRDEDGAIILPEEAAAIEWTGSETTYEEYETQRKRVEGLEANERELRGIESELGEIHERNTRNESPLELEEKNADIGRANELEKRAQEIRINVANRTPERANALKGDDQHAIETEASSLMAKPTIGTAKKL